MTTQSDRGPRWAGISRTLLMAVGGIVALGLLLLYLEGTFGEDRVAPGVVPLPSHTRAAAREVAVEERMVEDRVEWPATVTSRLVANLAPKVMARVLEIRAGVGAQVNAGDIVAVLDDRDVRARSQQADAALRAAEAQAAQFEADLRRARTLFQKQAMTQQDLDAVSARAKSSVALVAQARDAQAEARVMLGETTLRAPFAGVVAARLADPGDMAAPGKAVIIMHDPASLRLEANVAERCARALTMETSVSVRFATGAALKVRIEEIAPGSDPQSRTVLIKATLPGGADLHPGMFGTVQLACGGHTALLVPAQAVRRTGQLESVHVLVDGEARWRTVRTGKAQGDDVEVLSGLQAGETVLVEP